MAAGQPTSDDIAQGNARTAAEAYGDLARYLQSVPEDAWSGPTGCAAWTVRDLAGHVVGEAVWFPNLVRGVTRGETPLPAERYEDLKKLPAAELTSTLEEAANSIPPAVEQATTEQLQQTVDVGFMKIALWQATALPMIEAVYHHWDARAGRDPGATIPMPWAQRVAALMFQFAPMIADKEGIGEAPGTYLLRIGDAADPVTIVAQEGRVRLERGMQGTPDITLQLTVDQYVRLLAGRLDLAQALEKGEMQVEGDGKRALGLRRIFRGI